jgi:hypothetical protein
MEKRESVAPIGVILTAIGGVVLAVGSVLTWAKVSVDLNALADALGVDPSLLSGAGDTSKAFGGTSTSDGKIVLACGIVALVLAVVAYMRPELWKVLGIVAIVAGLVGAGVALYDISTKEDVASEANDALGPSLAAVGVDPGVLDNVIKVDLGIGIWASVAGGLAALGGGLLLVTRKPSPRPARAGTGSGVSAYVPSDSGFGTPSAPGPTTGTGGVAPNAPPPPPAPMPSEGEGVPGDGGDAPPPA